MRKYIITDNDLVKFTIETDYENIKAVFEKFLEPYLFFSEVENTLDYNFKLIFKNYNVNDINNYKIKGIYKYYGNTILFDSNVKNHEIDLKRIILDIYCRILEQKGGMFLHGSAISINNQGVVFVGDRGVGKTHTLLSFLEETKGNFIANDKVYIYKKNNKFFIKGIPAAIGIRLNTLNYFKKYNFLGERRLDKIFIGVKYFCKEMSIGLLPKSELKKIYILDNTSTDVGISKLQDFIVNSVYEEQEFINEIIPNSTKVSIEEFFEIPLEIKRTNTTQ